MDDDVRVVELLQITLAGRGYTVHTAFDGEAALEEVKRRSPDLLVLDVRLPRKSGFQVLEAVRSAPETARLPVILISGNPSSEARIQGLRTGADDYLVKPFSPRELIMKIRRILDRVGDQKLLRIRNEELEQQVREQREQMLQAHTEMHRNLMKIGTVLQRVEQINEQRNLRKVFEGFVQTIVADVGLEMVCLFSRDQKAHAFRPEVWRGVKDVAVLNLSLAVDSFICQVAGMEGRTMSLDEFRDYPRAADDLIKLSAAGFTNLTPVRAGGEVLVLIAGGDRQGGQPLDHLDIHLLSVLARAAGTSIMSANAFDDIRRSFVDTTAQLIATVESRYENVAGHSCRVHDLALRIAEQIGLALNTRQTVTYAALLHDLGALEEYDNLFEEQKLLSDQQRAALRQRSSGDVRRMLGASQMPEVAEALYHLNEYWDGSGMPDGLAAESIPLVSRIVAVANAFDALTCRRPHRPAYSQDDALRIIRNRTGHQFDPQIVTVLLEMLAAQAQDKAAASCADPAAEGEEHA